MLRGSMINDSVQHSMRYVFTLNSPILCGLLGRVLQETPT